MMKDGHFVGNIVFVKTPYIDRNSDVVMQPFSIVKIFNGMRRYMEKVRILDFEQQVQSGRLDTKRLDFYQLCADEVCKNHPEVVLFVSTKFINFSSTLCIAEKIKYWDSNIKVILGGHHSAKHAKYIINNFEYIDFIVLGNSIFCTISLIESLIEKKDVRTISNLVYRGSKIQYLHEEMYSETSLVNIYKNKNFIQGYINSNNRLHLLFEVGYGCSNNCLKCTKCFNKGKHMIIDLEKIKISLKKLADNQTADSVYIYDLFLLPIEDIKSICQYMIDNNIYLKWYTRSLLKVLDRSIFQLLKNSNCQEILISIDNRNDLGETIIDNHIREVFNIAEEYKLNVTFCYVIGNETNENNVRKFFALIYDTIHYHYVHYEFTLCSLNKYLPNKSVFSTFLMKGIDFYDEDVYFDEDIELAKKHPILLSNFFTYEANYELNVHIVKYCIELFKYYRRSIGKYSRHLDIDYYDVLKQLLTCDSEEDPWNHAIQVLTDTLSHPQVVIFETLVYRLKHDVITFPLLQYGCDLFILHIDYDVYMDMEADTFYIIKKVDNDLKIYKVTESIYYEIFNHIDHLQNMDSNYIDYLKKYCLL